MAHRFSPSSAAVRLVTPEPPKNSVHHCANPQPSDHGVRAVRVLDTVDAATDKAIGRATVLSRLFEALAAASEPGGLRVDFGDEREAQFWMGLRDIVDEIARASEEARDAVRADFDAEERG